MRRVCCVIYLAISMAASAAAQEGRPERTGNRDANGTREFLGLGPHPDPAAAERGGKLFAANCTFCHGAKATGGDTGPDLVRSSLVLHDEKGELIGPVVHDGRVGKGMPAFSSLTTAELGDVAAFLHMRVELAANRGTYSILNVLTGDRKAGEVYFNGAGGCSGCHSVTGDLAHIAAKLSPADLQQAFLYPASRSADRERLSAVKVSVVLATGESIAGTLKRLDDFNVSLYDADGRYRSIALNSNVKVTVEDKLAKHRELLDRYTDADMHDLTAYLATLK